MTDIDKDLASPVDPWLEGLLRDEATDHEAAYLADDGFTAKVMAALPAPVKLPAWRRPAVTALWVLAGAGLVAVMPAGAASEAVNEALRLVFAHRFTLSEIGVVVLGVSAATWAAGLYALRQD